MAEGTQFPTAEQHYQRGLALQSAGDLEGAAASYRLAIAAEPRHAKAHNNLGVVLHNRGDLSAAIGHYRDALAMDPGLPESARNLGIAWMARGGELRDAGRRAEALQSLRNAIAALEALPQAREEFAEAHYALGVALQDGEDFRAAAGHYRAALQINTEHAGAWLNLGFIDELTGDARDALENYRNAARLQPGLAQARYNYGMQLLLGGDFERGWEEYEWRWKLPELAHLVPDYAQPHWDGAPLEGKAILLYTEQGLGDVLQFARYVPLVERRAAAVHLRCPASLQPLLQRSFPSCGVRAEREALPEHDVRCALLSLPRLFKTRLESIPAPLAYLRAEPRAAADWATRLAAMPARLKVGLCWASDSRGGARKSLHLEMLAPLAAVPGIVFFSLQRGTAAGEAARPPAPMRIVGLPELRDFADDAALVANLDLVISVDTATAHLAGALGKPVWTLLPFARDWRWGLEGQSTPWYPSMRLFRQRRPSEWTAVIAQVAEALAAYR